MSLPSVTSDMFLTKALTVTSIDGTNIYAEGKGTFTKPHILFVHGFACSATSFDGFFEDPLMLSELYMVRYDVRGHGRSGKPTEAADYTSNLVGADAAVVIEAFKLDKPFYSGWSMGAAMSADVVAYLPRPLPLSGLILLAGVPYKSEMKHITTGRNVPIFAGMSSTDAETGLQTRIKFVDTFSAKPEAVPFSIKSSWIGNATYVTPKIAALVQDRAQPQEPQEILEEAKKGWPVLLIHGTEDVLFTGAALVERVKTLFKDAETHLIEGAGHMVFYDAQKESVDYILAFVKRVEGKST